MQAIVKAGGSALVVAPTTDLLNQSIHVLGHSYSVYIHMGWPRKRFDAAQTGFAPNVTDPSGDVTIDWKQPVSAPPAASPVIVDDNVIIKSNEGILAFALADGTLQWSVESSGGPYTLYHVKGHVVASGDEAVYLIEPTAGEIVWSYRTDSPVESFTVGPLSSANNTSQMTFDLQEADHDSSLKNLPIYVATEESFHPISPPHWERGCDTGSAFLYKFTWYDDIIYLGFMGGFVAIDSASGDEVCRGRGSRHSQYDIRAGQNTVIGKPTSSYITAFNPKDSHPRWSRTFPNQICTGVVLLDDTVLAVGGDHMEALALSDGEIQWQTELPSTRNDHGPQVGGPVATSQMIYMVTTEGHIRGISRETRAVDFEIEIGGFIASPVAVTDGTLVVFSETGGLIACR